MVRSGRERGARASGVETDPHRYFQGLTGAKAQGATPFLILWNHDRGEEALVEQRDLLLNTSLPPEVLDDLLGWTMVLASRFFDSEAVRSIFEKELKMLKDFPEVQEWIKEGELRGELRGDLRTARRICKHTLTDRFGQLSTEAEEYLDTRTVDELDTLIARVHRASTLADLGIPG